MLRSLLLIGLLLATHLAAAAPRTADPAPIQERVEALSPQDRDEVVWLARCLFSESNRPSEQRYVAWVVRNRVEAGFRGDTYREVVLAPRQFSAFNLDTPRRRLLLGLDAASTERGWSEALEVAYDIYHAPSAQRPFAADVWHFYSPVSMRGRLEPDWAEGQTPLDSEAMGVDPQRFRFFAGLTEGLDGGGAAVAPASTDASERIAQRTTRTRTRRARRPGFSGRVPRPARPSGPRR